MIRISEMQESCSIIAQICERIKDGFVKVPFAKFTNPNRGDIKTLMEAMIQHFKFFSSGIIIPEAIMYNSVEAPKGEFGTLIASYQDNNKPYRCHIRAPGFHHLGAINRISQNHSLADVVAIIGTLDIVFGEVDR
jgi:NADH-quinone oxidoreductase subunit D